MKRQIYQSSGMDANYICSDVRRFHKRKAHRQFRHQIRLMLRLEKYDRLPEIVSTGWVD